MKALLIAFDGATGRRPAGIKANDPKLQCYGWQQLATTPCLEVRVIEDDRDIAQYEGREAEGLQVLHDDQEIQAAIDANMPPYYKQEDENLVRMDVEQRQIRLQDIPGSTEDVLCELHRLGVKGIRQVPRQKLLEVYGPPR